jgi:hypothetical protein
MIQLLLFFFSLGGGGGGVWSQSKQCHILGMEVFVLSAIELLPIVNA